MGYLAAFGGGLVVGGAVVYLYAQKALKALQSAAASAAKKL